MTSSLFGSSPKVVNSGPQPTTSSQQQGLLSFLTNLLQGGAQAPGTPILPTGDAAVAPQTAGQTGIINQLLDLASSLNPGAAAPTANAATAAEGGALNFQAPQVAAPQTSFTPQAPIVSPATATQAFQQGVVAPTTANFLQTVIPSLNAAAGRSAGGAYSSDLSGATDQAVTNLDTTLAGEGAQYALGTQTANQSAQTATNQLLTQLAEANLGAKTATNSLDVGSILSGQGLNNQAIGLSPSVAQLPFSGASSVSQILSSLFPTVSTPQLTSETGLQTSIQDILAQQQASTALEQLMASLSVSPTEQSTNVVQPGSSGLIPGLLSGVASNPIVGAFGLNSLGLLPSGSSISNLFSSGSDRRLKTDVRRVGTTPGRTRTPVYTFRYKTDPVNVRRIGAMAQDVEKRVPAAVTRDETGMARVNYAELALADAYPDAA